MMRVMLITDNGVVLWKVCSGKFATILTEPRRFKFSCQNCNKTFNKRKNRALLTLSRSQKQYEIFGYNVWRKNINRKQLRLETVEIA